MAYDLQEQEQIADFKAWWNKYGNFIFTVLTVALLAVAAWNGWNWYQRKQAVAAAAMYEDILKAAAAKDGARVIAAANTIVDSYGRTVYAPLAALAAAKAAHDAGDLATAKKQLRWIVDQSHHPEFAGIARVRLAGVLLDEKAYDEALQVLAAEVEPAQRVAVADRRGDVLFAQGKFEEARKAYQQALELAEPGHPLRGLVQLKLDALPVAS
jgi:predicted negative regulator of RcsB-dependent stress response